MVSKTRLEAIYRTRAVFLRKLVSKFQSRYGGDWDELHAEALWWTVVAVHQWIPSRGSLDKFISFKAWTGMLEMRRKKAKRLTLNIEDAPPEQIGRHHSHFMEFLDELSHDARTIVNHVLHPDLDLALMIADRDGLRVIRRALREYLNEWDAERINDAFWDIEQKIQPALTPRMMLGRMIDAKPILR